MTLSTFALLWLVNAFAVASLFGRACQMGDWVDRMPADNTGETVCSKRNRFGENTQ